MEPQSCLELELQSCSELGGVEVRSWRVEELTEGVEELADGVVDGVVASSIRSGGVPTDRRKTQLALGEFEIAFLASLAVGHA